MKAFGYLLITAGFLAGSYFSVLDAERIIWLPFAGAMVAGVVGIVMVRSATRAAALHVDKLAEDMAMVSASLTRLVEKAEHFEAEKDDFNVYDLRHHIDEHFRDDLDAFVAARETIAHTFGLQPYAEVMSHFASGERHLNRVWSASTDGYIDEAHAYITKALEQLREAKVAFDGLEVQAA